MKLHFFQLNQRLMNPGQNLSIKHPDFSIVLTHLQPRVYFNTGFFASFLNFLLFFKKKQNLKKCKKVLANI